MIPFRSPFLAPIPQIEISGRLFRQSRRFTIFLIVATLVLLIFILIRWPVGRSGPLYLLYWVHDRIFLPVRAYTFTIFFPMSIIWWGISGTLLLLWTISKLADRSLILQPHMALLRFASHQPHLHPLLLHFAEEFQRRGYTPDLLKTVTERERALAGHYVGIGPDVAADPVALQAFARFTHLLVQLSLLSNSMLTDSLTAAVLWYETLLQLLLFNTSTEQPIENKAEDKVEALALLAACALPVANRLTAIAGQRSSQRGRLDEIYQETPFSIASLVKDLRLTLYSQPTMMNHLMATAQLQQVDATAARYLLAQAVANRRALLGTLLQQVALDERRSRQALAATDKSWHNALDATLSPAELALIGRLTLQSAIYTAYLGAQPAMALGYLDGVETLNFALAYTTDPREEAQVGRQRVAALLDNLPTATDYQLCAALQARQVTARQQRWFASPLDDEQLIVAQDFDLAFTYVATLAHAAGPPPLNKAYHSLEQAWVGNMITQLQHLGPGYRFIRDHTRPYVVTMAKQLTTSLRALRQQATKLDESYGLREEIAAKAKGARQQARIEWDKRYQQTNERYRDYIASGEIQLWLQQQWQRLQQRRQYLQHKLQQLLDAISRRFG